MTPTQRTQEEADRVDVVYGYVLSQLGVRTVGEVLALWQSIPAGQAEQTASTWLDRAVNLILTQRSKSRELGLAYYRLARALRTGSTIAHPLNEAEPDHVSLEMLRQEFEALVAETTGNGSTEVTAEQDPSGDDDSIEVEGVDGLSDALAADKSSEKPYTEKLLKDMATAASAAVDAIPDDMPAGDAKQGAKDLHLQHGAMVAAAGARTSMNGGRNATNQASVRDPRVIGWVRQHGRSDQPCYWCSMLISRQVLYKSEFTAGKGQRKAGLPPFLGDGSFKFHDNCHCTAEPVYSDADFASNPKYAINRYYNDLWNKYIKGKFSGNDAINEWRKLLARIRATDNSKAAQAAA